MILTYMHNMLWFFLIFFILLPVNVALAGRSCRYMLKAVKILTLKEKLLIAGLLALIMAGLGVRQYRQSSKAEIASTTFTQSP
jgi:hypothetical protein